MSTSIRKKPGREAQSNVMDIEPIVQATIKLLEKSPRGASRVDILAAMKLQPAAWNALRDALEATGDVTSVGRGPGLRHVHVMHLDAVPEEIKAQRRTQERSEVLNEARNTLRDLMRDQEEIDSTVAQEATGLRADPVRRLLLELVDEGVVERSGTKRSTKYRWVG